jgi:two-component sensor histidine kinase
LIREIHHRVKNNMQIISSILNLQSAATGNADCRGILKEVGTRIRAMSLVHEKLYRSPSLANIDLGEYLESLTAHLFQVYQVKPDQIRQEWEIEKLPLDINSAVPCGLLLNELISNALKHGFPKGRKGTLKIELRRGNDRQIELRVADDGIGFPAGLDFRHPDSFGLQIVNMLVHQLEGTIDMDRANGTAFTVIFRELNYKPRT